MKILKTLKLFSLMTLIGMISCTNDDDVVVTPGNNIPTYTNLQAFFNDNALTPTEITFDPGVANTFMTNSGNLSITLPANACLCNGTPCPGGTANLTVSITEYLNLDDMFQGNVHTESNENLLVTGGAFDWNITAADGSTVTLGQLADAQLNIQTNINGFTNDLQTFIGSTSTVNNMEVVNWTIDQNADGFFGDGFFNTQGINVGLVNCDALYDIAANNPTQFDVDIIQPTGVNTSQEMVWLFISDFPSTINITTVNNGIFSTYANSIPNGLNGTLVAVALDSDMHLMFGSKSITVAGDDNFTVDVDYGTNQSLLALVGTLVSN